MNIASRLHAVLARAGGRPKYRRTLLATVAALAVTQAAALGLMLAAPASAHDATVRGSASCASGGTYSVTWTITNDYNLSATGQVTDHSPSGSTLSASTYSLSRYGSATITQSGIAVGTNASLSIKTRWSDRYTRSDYGSVRSPSACVTTIAIPATPGANPPSCSSAGTRYVPPDTKQITWTATPGTTDQVTATANSGYIFTGGKHSITFTETVLPKISGDQCDSVTPPPVNPTITQPVCTGPGQASAGTFTLPADTAQIRYTAAGNVVTATTQPGYKFDAGQLPTGWTWVNTHHETFTVSYTSAGACLVDVSVQTAPSTTPPACTTSGHLVVPAQAHIVWSGGVNGAGAGTYTLVASAEAGYRLVGASTWTLTVLPQVTGDQCDSVVAPVSPAITQPVCTGPGQASSGSFTLPASTAEISYSASGDTVTALTRAGYKFDAGNIPAGWTWVTAHEETYLVHYRSAGDCPVTTPPPSPSTTPPSTPPATPSTTTPTPSPTTSSQVAGVVTHRSSATPAATGPLASTGLKSTALLGAAAALIWMGMVALTLAASRRRGAHS